MDTDSELRLWEDRTRYDKRLKWEIVFQNPSILFPADHKAADEPVFHRYLSKPRFHFCFETFHSRLLSPCSFITLQPEVE